MHLELNFRAIGHEVVVPAVGHPQWGGPAVVQPVAVSVVEVGRVDLEVGAPVGDGRGVVCPTTILVLDVEDEWVSSALVGGVGGHLIGLVPVPFAIAQLP